MSDKSDFFAFILSSIHIKILEVEKVSSNTIATIVYQYYVTDGIQMSEGNRPIHKSTIRVPVRRIP